MILPFFCVFTTFTLGNITQRILFLNNENNESEVSFVFAY